jgi:hypothetical protein
MDDFGLNQKRGVSTRLFIKELGHGKPLTLKLIIATSSFQLYKKSPE